MEVSGSPTEKAILSWGVKVLLVFVLLTCYYEWVISLLVNCLSHHTTPVTAGNEV